MPMHFACSNRFFREVRRGKGYASTNIYIYIFTLLTPFKERFPYIPVYMHMPEVSTICISFNIFWIDHVHDSKYCHLHTKYSSSAVTLQV